MTAPKILTEHVRQLGPPEWVAMYEGDEDSAGFGNTGEEAVADLTAKFPVEGE